MTDNDDSFFDPKNATKRQRVSFGKVGDFIKGTLVDVREIDDNGTYGKGGKVKIYEIMADSGSFHELDENRAPIEPAVETIAGEFYSVFGKPGIDDGMRRAKKGQIVGLKFLESKPASKKGYNPSKIIRVFLGAMNEEWMGQNSNDQDA